MNLSSLFDQLPNLLQGLVISLRVTAFSLVLGLPLGLVLGLLGTAPARLVRWATIAVVETLRGLPLLVLVYVIYFGLPSAGLTLQGEVALTAGITVSTGAYTSEIFRAGVLNVARGHREAARSLGLTPYQELRHIVLPQALGAVRIPVIAFSVLVFQGTAVGFAIGIPELLSRSYAIGSVTFDYLGVFTVAGLIYALVSILASVAVSTLSRGPRQPRTLPA